MPVKKTWKLVVQIQRNFLWDGSSGVKKILWIRWSNVYRPRGESDLEEKDLRLMNLSFCFNSDVWLENESLKAYSQARTKTNKPSGHPATNNQRHAKAMLQLTIELSSPQIQ